MQDSYRDELQQYIGCGKLVRTFDPKYDTFEISDGNKPVSIHLFQTYPGANDVNTGKPRNWSECNMTQAGQLGMPLGAKFEWVRLFVEDFVNPADVRMMLSKCYMDVITGSQTTARKLSLSAMVPVLPKGGNKIIEKWIKDGVVKVWPWLQAALPMVGVNPHEPFRVSIYSDEPLAFSGVVRGKVFLGPWLYRPDHSHPHYEDPPEDVVIDG